MGVCVLGAVRVIVGGKVENRMEWRGRGLGGGQCDF